MCQDGIARCEGESPCGCSCSCPETMTVEEKIRNLEERKKYFQEQAGIMDEKIAALKPVKRS